LRTLLLASIGAPFAGVKDGIGGVGPVSVETDVACVELEERDEMYEFEE